MSYSILKRLWRKEVHVMTYENSSERIEFLVQILWTVMCIIPLMELQKTVQLPVSTISV